MIADLDTYDSSARALTNAAQAVVVSTHYRQAPEHPDPAAHDMCSRPTSGH
ncbi:MAG: alpha/beta hydrolase fold domain-containing protein [Vicinamibacterales bacterium]